MIGTFIIGTALPTVVNNGNKTDFFSADLAMSNYHVQKTYLEAKFWNFEGTLFPETLKVG